MRPSTRLFARDAHCRLPSVQGAAVFLFSIRSRPFHCRQQPESNRLVELGAGQASGWTRAFKLGPLADALFMGHFVKSVSYLSSKSTSETFDAGSAHFPHSHRTSKRSEGHRKVDIEKECVLISGVLCADVFGARAREMVNAIASEAYHSPRPLPVPLEPYLCPARAAGHLTQLAAYEQQQQQARYDRKNYAPPSSRRLTAVISRSPAAHKGHTGPPFLALRGDSTMEARKREA